tara:strand:+ start:158 stop:478 length:321 start_codon:yes stop_codon:yes gene_type:complete
MQMSAIKNYFHPDLFSDSIQHDAHAMLLELMRNHRPTENLKDMQPLEPFDSLDQISIKQWDLLIMALHEAASKDRVDDKFKVDLKDLHQVFFLTRIEQIKHKKARD